MVCEACCSLVSKSKQSSRQINQWKTMQQRPVWNGLACVLVIQGVFVTVDPRSSNHFVLFVVDRSVVEK
eukprot:scaffold4823_cov175-Amphora_coffeaeformis.AAC.1